MSRRPVGVLLQDILLRAERIARHMEGLDRAAFLADDKTSDSVVRNLEVIGEATSRLPSEFRDRHPEVPWRRVIGLRNRVVHEYFDVDLELVWQIVHIELPELRTLLRNVLDALTAEEREG